jgi:putative membrane protein insertion efficiency factor
VNRILRAFAVLPLRLYQKVVSPFLGQRCRYHPSCSTYAVQAISQFGILRGLVLAGWRLLRCNPWSRGGFDPVEDQRLFGPKVPATGV